MVDMEMRDTLAEAAEEHSRHHGSVPKDRAPRGPKGKHNLHIDPMFAHKIGMRMRAGFEIIGWVGGRIPATS
jgi:hypothetical protein